MLARLRDGLTAGSARAGSEAALALERLAVSAGVGGDDVVWLRVDATGRLAGVEVPEGRR